MTNPPKADRDGTARAAREVLAHNVRKLREANELRQVDLSERTGLSKVTIGLVERGKINLSIDNIEMLAHAFGVEAYILLVPPSS